MVWFSACWRALVRWGVNRRGVDPVRARPRVDPLEERLPPGDLLLARVLGPAWLAARPPETGGAQPVAPPAQAAPRNTPAVLVAGTAAAAHAPSADDLRTHRGSQAPAAAVDVVPSTAAATLPDPLGRGDLLAGPDDARPAAPARHRLRPADAADLSRPGEATAGPGISAPPAARDAEANPPTTAATGAPGLTPPAAPNDLVADALPTAAVPLPADGTADADGPGAPPPPPRGSVHALFGLEATTGGPFPSDRFTVADHAQNTDRRVNLPLPDCTQRPSDCEDLAVLNELDGFNLQPRLSVPFDGPIDVHSVSSRSMFLVSLGDTLNRHDRGGQVVGINQVVWDTFTNTLHVESDQLLDQHTRYALIVTDGIRDPQGRPVAASRAFARYHHDLAHSPDPVLRFYGQELDEAVRAARRAGVRERDLVDASVFTTESATAVLEKIRDQIHAATPEPADFNLGPNGERTVFNLDDVQGIRWEQQTGDDPPSFTPFDVELPLMRLLPGAIGQVAFGKYVSPDYEVHPDQYIPAVPTRTGTPAVQGQNDIYFNLVLPAGPKPAGGWPVAIFGHGMPSDKNTTFARFSLGLASQGIASIYINAVGNGFGPLGTLTVDQTDGTSTAFSAGGRGVDLNGDHTIDSLEGSRTPAPRSIIWWRDGLRQTVADQMQLVREIEVGMDVGGDGISDLDPSRIYYFGQSFGGIYGTIFMGVEPDVRAGVLSSAGGSIIGFYRLAPSRFRPAMELLNARVPSLLNPPGITRIDGLPVSGPFFNDDEPLRDGIPYTATLADGTTQVIQAPVVNTVPGAMPIQELLENVEWVGMSGDPLAYAPHLRKAPLPGVPAKSMIVQFAKGDQQVPNPAETALVRAGNLADRTTYYRHDLAYAEDPTLPKNPHGFLSLGIDGFRDSGIALGAQEQIATFFASDGTEIIHPEPARFFETPIQEPLPEDLNYIV